MNSLNTIRTIVAGSNNTLAIATQELPTALVNQPQLGNANTIGAIYAHTLLTLDHFYQTAMQNKVQVLTTADFAARLGLADPDQLPWATLNALSWDWDALQAYGQAVLAAVDRRGTGPPPPNLWSGHNHRRGDQRGDLAHGAPCR